jgi:pyruvate carboxylase subunit B
MVAELAIQNVVGGRRYGTVSREARDYLRGVYGAPPGPVNDALIGDLVRVTGRSALLLPPQMEKLEAELKNLGFFRAREDVLTFALFGAAALPFLRDRGQSRLTRRAPVVVDRRLEFLTAFMERRRLRRIEIAERDFHVRLVKRGPVLASQALSPVMVEEALLEEAAPVELSSGPVVRSPLGGVFYRASGPGQPPFAAEGAEVTAETVIGLVEAMKLFHEVKAGVAGTIERFEIANGGAVEQDGVLCRLRATA